MAEVVNALDRVSVVLVRCDEVHRALHLVEDRPFWPLTETVLSARDVARQMLADMRSAAQSTGEDGRPGAPGPWATSPAPDCRRWSSGRPQGYRGRDTVL